ncbi:hypothetical protein SNE40_011882 [Patella caerulea]|uniref:Uncharacterized protein n=1 Tax=Patella caerulea TaxID=87958 RepID=A0AAN8JKN2_PATCE
MNRFKEGDRQKETQLDFDAKQEARYEAMRQSRYSSIVYKQHEELQRRFERQASLIEKTKKALASDIRKIRIKRREYLDKYTEVKRDLDYFRQTSSIAESRISTLRKRHFDFQQSQRVAQFLDQYGDGAGIYLYGDFYPGGRINFLPNVNGRSPVLRGSQSGSSRSANELYLTDGGKSKTQLSILSPSTCTSGDRSFKTSELLEIELKRNVESYRNGNLGRRKDIVHLFSVQNVTGRPVHVKHFPGKKLFK